MIFSTIPTQYHHPQTPSTLIRTVLTNSLRAVLHTSFKTIFASYPHAVTVVASKHMTKVKYIELILVVDITFMYAGRVQTEIHVVTIIVMRMNTIYKLIHTCSLKKCFFVYILRKCYRKCYLIKRKSKQPFPQ
jgi:hypothetical protein